MRKHGQMLVWVSVGLTLVVGSLFTMAQAPGGGPPDPAQIQEMILQRYNEALKVTDDEWNAIKPLIEGVMTKQRATMGLGGGGMMPFGGPRGGQGGPGGQGGRMRGFFGEPNPALEALQTALESETTPAAEIEAKLKDLRNARKKANEELQKAREELRKILKIRQEATLVSMGLLD